MRLNRMFLAAAVLGTAAASCWNAADAHGGGGLRGPPGEDPPNSRDPVDPPPPPEGPSHPAPVLGDDWTQWWDANQREFPAQLPTTRSPVRPVRQFGRIGFVRRVSDDTVANVLVPRLRTLLANEKEEFHVRSAAAIALARIGDAASAPTLRDVAQNERQRHYRAVEENAALALGLLPDDRESRALLLRLVLTPDDPGRSFRRPFAAIALGLLGGAPDDRRIATRALLEVIACEQPGSGVRPACLVALGLLADESAVPDLVDLVTERSAFAGAMPPLTSVERAFAVETIARIGSPGPDGAAVDALTSLVEHSRVWVADEGRRSAVIALGPLAAHAGARTRTAAALLRTISTDGDVAAADRHLALVSLGRLAAATGVDPRTRAEALAHLRLAMDRGRDADASFAAIALAIAGRALEKTTGRFAEEVVREPIRSRFVRETSPDRKGAFALASGLVGDEDAAPALRATLVDGAAEAGLRGWCARALGMIGDAASREPLREIVQENTDGALTEQCVRSLDLLGDPDDVDGLVQCVLDPNAPVCEFRAAALTLGRIGDERTVATLLEVVNDTRRVRLDFTRGRAIFALGLLASRRDSPAPERLAVGRNYMARDCALDELLTIL